MTTTPTQTLIIGAGPGGLAVAGWLRTLGIPFELLEKSGQIAHSWHNHYDRLCLHTVKQLSHLPHLLLPDAYPLYVPREDLAQYYESYAEKFQLQPHFHQSVNAIRKVSNGWQVQTEEGNIYESPTVVIATGTNRVPNWPHFPGQENFEGTISHSKTYKNPQPYLGQRVLVVGFGNTGAEVALDLSEHEVPTWVSVRSPVNVVPRDLNGRPTQLTAKQLAKLPFGLGDWLGTQIRKIYFGNLKPYGLQPALVPPVVQLRETGKTPIIDLGTIAHIKAGKIKVVPGIDHFTEKGVQFTDGSHHEFDHILLATGYHAQIDDFLEDTTGLLDENQLPQTPIGTGKHEGLYFIGFDNYKLGGILGTIFTDSELIAQHIQATQGVPQT